MPGAYMYSSTASHGPAYLAPSDSGLLSREASTSWIVQERDLVSAADDGFRLISPIYTGHSSPYPSHRKCLYDSVSKGKGSQPKPLQPECMFSAMTSRRHKIQATGHKGRRYTAPN